MKYSKRYLYFLILVFVLAVSMLVFRGATGFKAKASHQTEKSAVRYQCSMHPKVVSEKPGNCPICGMKLQRVEQAPKVLYYRNPMRPDVVSPTPAKDEMGMAYIPIYGTEETTTKISVPGHAEVTISSERQQLIGVRTDAVKEMPLTSTIHVAGHVAYNPDISQALAEYADAYQAYWRAKKIGTDVAREWRDGLVELAEVRLRLAGFDDKQMAYIKTTTSGKSFLIDNRFIPKNLTLPENAIWVIADIYEPDAVSVLSGQHAVMTAPALPGLKFEGEVKSVDPVLNSMTRIVRARIEVPQALDLKAGMSLDIMIEVPLGTKIAVPVEAVLHTGERELVFLDRGEGRIEPREVSIGRRAGNDYEVLSGLSAGDKVITSAGFLIDSESRFQAAAQGFSVAVPKQPDTGKVEPNVSAHQN